MHAMEAQTKLQEETTRKMEARVCEMEKQLSEHRQSSETNQQHYAKLLFKGVLLRSAKDTVGVFFNRWKLAAYKLTLKCESKAQSLELSKLKTKHMHAMKMLGLKHANKSAAETMEASILELQYRNRLLKEEVQMQKDSRKQWEKRRIEELKTNLNETKFSSTREKKAGLKKESKCETLNISESVVDVRIWCAFLFFFVVSFLPYISMDQFRST